MNGYQSLKKVRAEQLTQMAELSSKRAEAAATSETYFRPTEPKKKQITFLWQPQVSLVELVYNPKDGLTFISHTRSGTCPAGDYTPLPWVKPYVRAKATRLASNIDEYGNLDDLAQRVRDFIHQYFECHPLFEAVATLYVLHTWVYEAFDAVPYLRFIGPPGTGKSRGTETIGALCYHPVVIAGAANPAPMFRIIEALGGTVLFDEADIRNSQIGTDIVKILNCGYKKGLPVSRTEPTPDGDFIPRLYEVFGPKILNGRRRFQDDAVETRCLSYTPTALERADVPTQLPKTFHEEVTALQNQLLKWRFDNLDTVEPSRQRITQLSSRMNQILIPLITVSEMMNEASRKRYLYELFKFAKNAEEQAKEVQRESIEAALIYALTEFVGHGTWPTCGQLAQAVIHGESANDPRIGDWLSPKKAGALVRELGFRTHHTRSGSVVQQDKQRLNMLQRRFGIHEPAEERVTV